MQGRPRRPFPIRFQGKLIADSSKGLKISYDWRGMPLREQIALNYFGARYLDPMLGL